MQFLQYGRIQRIHVHSNKNSHVNKRKPFIIKKELFRVILPPYLYLPPSSNVCCLSALKDKVAGETKGTWEI